VIPEGELLRRLLIIKIKHRFRARNWKAYLARSLYNAAKNFARDRNRQKKNLAKLKGIDERDESFSMRDVLAAPEESIELRADLLKVWQELPPDLRALWDVLVTEQGNVSAAARKLGRQRKTVEYWITKLRHFIERREIV
jgi:DNA-directed RNA polymerase specialized sigma24 family protein